jgi:hypothetical protein
MNNKVKLKFILCLDIKFLELKFHAFRNSALDVGER